MTLTIEFSYFTLYTFILFYNEKVKYLIMVSKRTDLIIPRSDWL